MTIDGNLFRMVCSRTKKDDQIPFGLLHVEKFN